MQMTCKWRPVCKWGPKWWRHDRYSLYADVATLLSSQKGGNLFTAHFNNEIDFFFHFAFLLVRHPTSGKRRSGTQCTSPARPPENGSSRPEFLSNLQMFYMNFVEKITSFRLVFSNFKSKHKLSTKWQFKVLICLIIDWYLTPPSGRHPATLPPPCHPLPPRSLYFFQRQRRSAINMQIDCSPPTFSIIQLIAALPLFNIKSIWQRCGCSLARASSGIPRQCSSSAYQKSRDLTALPLFKSK